MARAMSAADIARLLYDVELRIRRFEETLARLFADGQLPGFVHLSVGQEAVAAGACAALGERDRDRLPPTRTRPLHRQGRGYRTADG